MKEWTTFFYFIPAFKKEKKRIQRSANRFYESLRTTEMQQEAENCMSARVTC